MRLLIDTHAFLWFVTNDQLLSATALGLMTDPINEIVISPASFWEVAIKVSIGKYPMTLLSAHLVFDISEFRRLLLVQKS